MHHTIQSRHVVGAVSHLGRVGVLTSLSVAACLSMSWGSRIYLSRIGYISDAGRFLYFGIRMTPLPIIFGCDAVEADVPNQPRVA